MLTKWWALQHIAGGEWFAESVVTIFGLPFCSTLYVAEGPFADANLACEYCEQRNLLENPENK